MGDLEREVEELKGRVNKKRAALEFYADESKYADRGDYWQIVNDEGETARRGLGIDE